MKTRDYQPISCNFYDILEAAATLKKECIIKIINTDNQEEQIVSRITNLFTREKGEFMELENGRIIRLDQLVMVDGEILKNYC